MNKAVDFTKGNPLSLIARFSVPIFIGYLFQQVYSLVDRIIVGQLVGADAFSAVGSTTAITSMFMSMCIGASSGAGVIVSQYYGARDEKNTAKAISNGAYVNIAVAIVMTIIALVTIRPILTLLQTPAELMDDAASYMLIYMAGLIAVSAYYVPFSIMQALGDSTTPLIFLIVCSVLNVVLDLLFVGPLQMGVNGAAIATVLAQCISAVFCIVYAFRKMPIMKLAVKHAAIDWKIIKETVRIGLPTGLQFALIYLSSVILQRTVNRFGATVIGAFAATTQVEILIQQIYSTLGTTMATYAAQNIGAKKPKRIREALRTVLFLCAGVSVLWLICALLGGNIIMGVFVDDSAMTGIAATGARITAVFFMAFGVTTVLRRLLAGVGDSAFTLTSGIVEIAARIILGFSLTAIPALGMWGIWLTTGFTWLATAIYAIWRYRRNCLKILGA
ncbi:MATE family efflux transporter [Clostridiaceae bacterium NSJ-31]|uniref:Probable multidrug resistance protein NorM n=1 Tax=Ligaoa zhengdingensis TaxID=2763658 RepID=A0A926I583_9FIRM|nr:MATE family efflux transporter [Ligaoa zhengdingensis]